MKFSISTSLFLRLSWTFTCLMVSHFAISQQQVDSTDFYKKTLLDPEQGTNIAAAFDFYERGYLADLKNQDTIAAANKLRIISIGQSKMGATHESEATTIKALELLDGLPTNPNTLSVKTGVYIDLGKVYRNLQNPANSLHYYEKALQHAQDAMDSIASFNNKGNVLVDMENYELAQKEFTAAYQKSLMLSDTLAQARILDNLGFAQSKSDNPEGIENMMSALNIRLGARDLSGIYSSYRHLAIHYDDRKKNKEALEYAEKAYVIAKTINSPAFIKNALTNLLKIKGDSTAREFIRLNDSMEVSKLNIQNKYAAMQYNISKEKEKTEAVKLLQEQEKRGKQAFQFLGVFLMIALVAYYFIQRALSKRKTQEHIYRTETRIARKIHDEVSNDVYHLMNKIQLNSLNDDALLDDLEEIYKRTRDISRENSDITITEDFSKQLSDLLQSYQYEGTVISIQNISKINWKSTSVLKKTSIYRILQELMTNMKKHSGATQVLLSFEQNKNKIYVKYRDNGVGGELKNKNGLKNMESRIKAINGSIIFDTAPHKGFKATLII